jgi:hypothetical protein
MVCGCAIGWQERMVAQEATTRQLQAHKMELMEFVQMMLALFFNATAASLDDTPKLLRALVTLADVAQVLLPRVLACCSRPCSRLCSLAVCGLDSHDAAAMRWIDSHSHGSHWLPVGCDDWHTPPTRIPSAAWSPTSSRTTAVFIQLY